MSLARVEPDECAGSVERRPGRPRSTACDEAILRAALDEYAQRGYEGLSVDAVAARAGVSKATIYRRYQCKTDLVLAAATAVVHEDWEPPSGAGLRDALRALLEHLRGVFSTTAGRAARMVVADSVAHPDLAEAFHGLVARRRTVTRRLIQQGVASGELTALVDPEVLTDMLAGPVFYRLFISGDPVDDTFLDSVVDTALRACAL
jgi:AcrR family transcriptional regulator